MGEDYEIEVDGVMLNISKVARMRKRRFGEIRFNKLKSKFDIKVISDKGGLILFSIQEKQYYWAPVAQKIRRVGEKEWSGKVMTILKSDFNTKIPLKKQIDKKTTYNLDDMAFGKHKDKTWLEVEQTEPSYTDWLLKTTKNESLKVMLRELKSI